MISITRVLPFELYAASTYLAHRRGILKHKFCYYTYLRFGPYFGILGIPVAMWLMIHFWTLPGKHGVEFGVSCGLLWYVGYMACYRWVFTRKMRKLYTVQDLGSPWTIELSEDGIRSAMKSADTRFDWSFFDSFVESDAMFTLLKKERLLFLTIGKDSLIRRRKMDSGLSSTRSLAPNFESGESQSVLELRQEIAMRKPLFPDKYDWHGCDAVQFDPEKLSGRGNVEGQRTFADGILDCFLSGQTVDEIVDDYGVRRDAVERILAFAAAKGFVRPA